MSEKSGADLRSGKIHRALADEHRARIVDELRSAPDGMDVRELGRTLGLHANTVRWHLGVLADAGIVSSHPGSRSTPGRPRMVYVLSADTDAVDAESHRLLATILGGALSELEDGARIAQEAGHAWGRYLVQRPPPNVRTTDEQAVRAIVELLGEQGFRASVEDREIRMHRCPYRELAPGIVCAVHEGLIGGALAELGSELEVERLDAFVEPGLCIARLRPRGDGARPARES